MKKISVIVPVYNVEKYLRECLESIINQSLKDIEIIVVNDGSKDRSLDIIKEYKVKYSRIILIDQENKGLSEARNVGIRAATGEYIAFVDSDDYLNLDMYKDLYENSDKANIVFSNINIYNDKTKEIKKLNLKISFPEKKEGIFYFKYSSISSCNKIYKRMFLIENNLYFEKGLKYEDIIYTLRCCLASKTCKYVNKNYYHYRVDREGSITTKENIEVKINSFKKIINLLEKEELKYKNKAFSFSRIYFQKISMELWIAKAKKIKISKNKIKEFEINSKKIFSKKYSEIEFNILKSDIQEILQDNSYVVNLFNDFYYRYKLLNLKIFRRKLLNK